MNERVWGPWALKEVLGEGSFGKVYKAERNVLNNTYYSAVKIVSVPQNENQIKGERASGMNDESIREYFHSIVEDWHTEIQMLETLKGVTNIVAVEDYEIVEYTNEIKWDIYIRMELLTSFNDYVTENRLSEKKAVQLGIDILQALLYCEKKQIIHRDIKPENIFVSQFGDFKLGDFGIARQLEKTSSSLSKKGTYMYMAPEVYKGENYDATVDMYSLGLVLYRLFNKNRMPFIPTDTKSIRFADKEKSIIERMKGSPLPKPVLATERISEIILKACAYQPKDRYSSIQDMYDDLKEVYANASDELIVLEINKIMDGATSNSNYSTLFKTETKSDNFTDLFKTETSSNFHVSETPDKGVIEELNVTTEVQIEDETVEALQKFEVDDLFATSTEISESTKPTSVETVDRGFENKEKDVDMTLDKLIKNNRT